MMRTFVTAVILLLVHGCAPADEPERDYLLAVRTSDPELVDGIVALTERFNDRLGYRLLSLSTAATPSASEILIVDGLAERRGMLGFGQWRRREVLEPHRGLTGGSPASQRMAMTLQFDREFLTQRLRSPGELGMLGGLDYELQTLFFHEVGHGLTLPHTETSEQAVMHPDIFGEKDHRAFFGRILTLLQ